MRFLSVCSGIEAASVAWNPIGWEAAAVSEIDPFACAVLAHHYPEVQNLGDMTKFQEWPDVSIDLLCGGTPCQSFSVAGLRGGMADPRGNLALVFLGVLDRYRPRWVVWENVPGVRSSSGGRDFGAFLGALGELGYGWAYRSLDAQYFGLAQRRERVFVVGYLGDWRRAAAVLFERACLSWHPAPSRKAGEGTAPTIAARTRGGGGLGTDFDCDGGLIAKSLNAHGQRLDGESETLLAHSLRADGFDASEDGTGGGTPLVSFVGGAQQDEFVTEQGITGALAHASNHHGGHHQPKAVLPTGVRRLTPRECERLQGFPDDYTLIPYRRKQAADGPRYKALGNSWAVPVVRWIGQRISTVDSIT